MSIPFFPADILLPARADGLRWSCVACDQYTSQPAYWEAADALVGDAPSTLRLILPEVYLAETDARKHEQLYAIAKCLKCGLCLEVCPNYHSGGEFYGAVLANESYLITSQSKDKKHPVIKEYREHFGAGCSKALSCRRVCPMEIETISSIMGMNRK